MANAAVQFLDEGETITFSYDVTVDDGNGGTDTARATVDITCTNDGPSAGDDSVDVTEDTAADVTAQLLANDDDIDGDGLAITGVSNATGGTVDLTAGVVTFTGSANLCGDGVGGFDYDMSDGQGGSDSASVTVDITCVNDPPVAAADVREILAVGARGGSLIQEDGDAELASHALAELAGERDPATLAKAVLPKGERVEIVDGARGGMRIAVLDHGAVRKRPDGRFRPGNVHAPLSAVVPDVKYSSSVSSARVSPSGAKAGSAE